MMFHEAYPFVTWRDPSTNLTIRTGWLRGIINITILLIMDGWLIEWMDIRAGARSLCFCNTTNRVRRRQTAEGSTMTIANVENGMREKNVSNVLKKHTHTCTVIICISHTIPHTLQFDDHSYARTEIGFCNWISRILVSDFFTPILNYECTSAWIIGYERRTDKQPRKGTLFEKFC